uniref:Uncharacterized protein n=1 Tax=Cacopsylla melanoneura TaxID=428564 RepID=A0A8D8QZ39_9HEMI
MLLCSLFIRLVIVLSVLVYMLLLIAFPIVWFVLVSLLLLVLFLFLVFLLRWLVITIDVFPYGSVLYVTICFKVHFNGFITLGGVAGYHVGMSVSIMFPCVFHIAKYSNYKLSAQCLLPRAI